MTPNRDPRYKHERPPYPEQQQPEQPGETERMRPRPDHGEQSYEGSARLEGLRALITGGDSGIGRAVAIAYAREGADVAISYLPEEQAEAQQTKRHMNDAGRRSVLLPGDLRDEAECVKLIERTVVELDGLDVLVLNAGTQHRREPDAQIDRAQIMEVFETNLVAPLILMREAAPHLQPGAVLPVTGGKHL